jgi:hypothetical protein
MKKKVLPYQTNRILHAVVYLPILNRSCPDPHDIEEQGEPTTNFHSFITSILGMKLGDGKVIWAGRSEDAAEIDMAEMEPVRIGVILLLSCDPDLSILGEYSVNWVTRERESLTAEIAITGIEGIVDSHYPMTATKKD